MNIKFFHSALIFLSVLSVSCFAEPISENQNPIEQKKSLFSKEEISQISTCLGNLLWQNLNDCCSYYDIDIVLKTIKELSNHNQAPMDESECSQLMETVWGKLMDEEERNNLVLAQQFLEKIAQQPNVVEIVKGKLYYEIIQPGGGTIITDKSSPLLHFKEIDLAGSVIRDTTKRGPLKIKLSETILGFSKGVNGMRMGEKRKIFVHPDLAYGKFGGQQSQQLLIFEVEIINECSLE
jgi:peptidylprolyl isomerase